MNQLPTLESQTLAALIGECIMPSLDADTFATDAEYRLRMIRLVREHKVGGFCMFAKTPEVVANVVTVLQKEAADSHGVPLIFSCDCEFGLRMRLKRGGTEFPDAMAIAKSGDPDLAREVGRAIAREMRTLGLAWNFAPVADVNNNPQNPIINTRSFGDDTETVITYAVPFMEGMQQAGVAGMAKHFPGHGDTSVDSHRDLPFMDGGLQRFESIELPPFEALIKSCVASVMTGHLAAPLLAAELGAGEKEKSLPATLSRILTTTLLRERLGFDGVVVTDAMQMHAITKRFGEDEAAVLAVEAGADVVLMPADGERAFEAVMRATEVGRLTRALLEERVRRIWRLKEWASSRGGPPDPTRLRELEAEHASLSKEVAKKAIEIKGNLDLSGSPSLILICDDREDVVQKANRLQRKLSNTFGAIQIFTPKTWDDDAANVNENTIIASFHRARGFLTERATEWTVPRMMASIATSMTDRGIAPQGLILFGSPYLDGEFKTAPDFVIKTFSESGVSIEAVVEWLSTIAG